MKKENHILSDVLKLAEEERYLLKHPYVGSEHLFLSILKNKNSVSAYLKEYNVTYSLFKKELIKVVGSATKDFKENLYTPLLRKIIKRSENINTNINDVYESLFISLLDEGEGIAVRILLRMEVDLDEIYFDLKEKQKLKNMDESNKVGTLLNKTINLNEKVLFREKELEKIIMTLSRKKKCNPLLIGPAGVGKTAIVEELVRRVERNQVPYNLKDNKVYMIEMGSLISGTKYRGEFEERLNKIIKELINYKKAIIFIDEIHTMVGAGGAEGAINASDILKPYLARGDIKIIGATTNSEYHKFILKDKALVRRFDIVDINEPNKESMYKLLIKIKKEYENYHCIKVSNKVIKKIIDLSDYYLKSVVNPDKSIDLLDSSCAYAKMNHKKILDEEDVLNTIFYKTNNSLIKNKEFTTKLKQILNKYLPKVITNRITNAFKIRNSKPISFIIDNPKLKDIILNELNEINIVNIDIMMDVNNSSFINKNSNDNVFSTLIDKPYSLVTLTNIEQASKTIVSELLSIINDGYISVKYNEKIYFNNAIIILLLNNKNKNKTEINNKNNKNTLDEDLIKSVSCDLRNITLKDCVNL